MQLYRENYINALHTELLEMVEKHLTPVAVRYGYSEIRSKPPSSGGPWC